MVRISSGTAMWRGSRSPRLRLVPGRQIIPPARASNPELMKITHICPLHCFRDKGPERYSPSPPLYPFLPPSLSFRLTIHPLATSSCHRTFAYAVHIAYFRCFFAFCSLTPQINHLFFLQVSPKPPPCLPLSGSGLFLIYTCNNVLLPPWLDIKLVFSTRV